MPRWLICLLGVIILSFLLTAASEEKETPVFSNSGENVSLPCNNALSDCTSTTWIYNRHSNSSIELFAEAIKNKNIERHERLRLGSDCSLNILKSTKEDHGFYTCRQYVNGQTHGTDARIYLHVLEVSPSSTQIEIRPGSSVTLSCQLYSYEPCDTSYLLDGIRVVWKNQTVNDLQTDSRYQISSENCISTLTTRLQNEDNNTELRCLVTKRNKIKTSASYTIKFKDLANTNPPVTSTNSETSTGVTSETEDHKTHVSYRVIIVIAVVALFAAPTVILLQIICAERAENRRSSQNFLADRVMLTILK